ncbi:MAG: hypothetical protein R3F55_21305 [Alphaproteobacteria bacterium]
MVAAVGGEPAALLAWVAQSVAADGYAGAMRGAGGTVGAAAGSAADRALPQALLRAADPTVELRFAGCTLDTAVAARLAQAASGLPAAPEPLIAVAGRYAPEIADPAVRQLADAMAAIWDDAVTQTDRTAATLARALDAAALPYAAPVVDRAAVQRAMADHVWLQVRHDGDWLDLDPDADGGRAGARLCEPTWLEPALPAAEQHWLTLRVVAELRGAGRQAMVEHSWPLTALADDGVTVMIAESNGRGTLVAEPEPLPARCAIRRCCASAARRSSGPVSCCRRRNRSSPATRWVAWANPCSRLRRIRRIARAGRGCGRRRCRRAVARTDADRTRQRRGVVDRAAVRSRRIRRPCRRRRRGGAAGEAGGDRRRVPGACRGGGTWRRGPARCRPSMRRCRRKTARSTRWSAGSPSCIAPSGRCAVRSMRRQPALRRLRRRRPLPG